EHDPPDRPHRARDRGLRAAREPAPPRLPRRGDPDRRLPRALRPGRVAGVPGGRGVRDRRHRRRARDGGRLDAPGARHVRDALPRHDPRRLPHARRGAWGRRARPAAARARAPPPAPDAPARPLRGGGLGLRGVRDGRLPRRHGPHEPGRGLVARPHPHARPRAGGGGGDPRGHRARGLGVPRLDGERDRGLHGVRRGARRRPARPDRRGAHLGDAHGRRPRRDVRAAVRGALPARSRRADDRPGRLHPPRGQPRPVRRRPGRRRLAVGLGGRLPRARRGRRCARVRAAGPL
ncbi:MAG: hypothetical protein AVDCRST_MAG30-1953, partial [uncultured Solirubrobacteraceae bacterium]